MNATHNNNSYSNKLDTHTSHSLGYTHREQHAVHKMPRAKRKNKSDRCCRACTDRKDGGIFSIVGPNGKTDFVVRPWDCKQTDVVYVVRCRCRACKHRPAFYVGETYQTIAERFHHNRSILAGTELAAHFRRVHPGVSMFTKIQIHIVSEEIPDRDERVLRQNQWIYKMREASLFEDTVLNKYPKPL